MEGTLDETRRPPPLKGIWQLGCRRHQLRRGKNEGTKKITMNNLHHNPGFSTCPAPLVKCPVLQCFSPFASSIHRNFQEHGKLPPKWPNTPTNVVGTTCAKQFFFLRLTGIYYFLLERFSVAKKAREKEHLRLENWKNCRKYCSIEAKTHEGSYDM